MTHTPLRTAPPTSRRPLRQRIALAGMTFVTVAALTACSADVGSIPGVTTSGDVRILGLDPDVRDCVVRAGTWFVVLGEGLGDEALWESGDASASFPPHPPGVPAAAVQLVGSSLFLQVPSGAASGTVILDLGAAGSAEIPITVEGPSGELAVAVVATVCASKPPPTDGG